MLKLLLGLLLVIFYCAVFAQYARPVLHARVKGGDRRSSGCVAIVITYEEEIIVSSLIYYYYTLIYRDYYIK